MLCRGFLTLCRGFLTLCEGFLTRKRRPPRGTSCDTAPSAPPQARPHAVSCEDRRNSTETSRSRRTTAAAHHSRRCAPRRSRARLRRFDRRSPSSRPRTLVRRGSCRPSRLRRRERHIRPQYSRTARHKKRAPATDPSKRWVPDHTSHRCTERFRNRRCTRSLVRRTRARRGKPPQHRQDLRRHHRRGRTRTRHSGHRPRCTASPPRRRLLSSSSLLPSPPQPS